MVKLMNVNPLPTSDYHHLPKNLYKEFNIRTLYMLFCRSHDSILGIIKGCGQRSQDSILGIIKGCG